MGLTAQLNALGWLLQDQNGRQFQYDSAGNVTGIQTSLGTISARYDALDRLSSLTDPSPFSGTVTNTYIADPLGAFLVGYNGEGRDSLSFDAVGRLVSAVTIRNGRTYELGSTYDPASTFRSSLQLRHAWASTVGYHYNDLKLLDQITDLAGRATHIAYSAEGMADSTALPNGVTVTGSSSAIHLPGVQSYSTTSAENAFFRAYGYDKAGRVNVKFAGSSSAIPNPITTFGYWSSGAGRLGALAADSSWNPSNGDPTCTEIVAPDGSRTNCGTSGPTLASSRSYNYDSRGNWTDVGTFNLDTLLINKVTSDSIHNHLGGFPDTLVGGSVDPYDGSWDFNGRTRTLGWSATGKLLSYDQYNWSSHTNAVTYGYDAFGRRARKTVNGVTSYFIWDGDNPYAEIDASGNPVREYTFYPGIDVPHSVRIGGKTYYYALEYPGHVIGLMDSTGNVQAEYGYSPFGVLTNPQSFDVIGNTLRYGAREYDAESGFYYQRARYYDPSVGRFLSPDPLGASVPGNPYEYANNDPINATDPSGMAPCVRSDLHITELGTGLKIWFIDFDCSGASTGEPGDAGWHGAWGAQPFGGFADGTGSSGGGADAGQKAEEACRDNILATTGSALLDIAGASELARGVGGLYDFFKVARTTRTLPLSVPRAIIAGNRAKLFQLARGVGFAYGSGVLQGIAFSASSEAAMGSPHDWVNYLPVPIVGTLNGLWNSYKACFRP